jgi:putative addiction module component (TIGR02574 family)
MMAIPMEVLAVEALALPAEERSQLLDRLISSLEAEPLDAQWEQEWPDEVDRREAAIESGQSRWIDGSEIVARLRAGLK